MRLWITTALALVLAGVIYWTSREEAGTAKPKLADGAVRLLDVPEDQFTRIELKRPAEDSVIVIERGGAGWKLTAPAAYEVDSEAVNGLLKTLAVLDAGKLVDEKPKSFDQYGFLAPRLVVTAKRKDGKQTTVEFANETPLKNEYYARVAGDGKLYAVAAFVYMPLDKRLPDLRDRRVATFDPAAVKSIELTARGATIAFAPTAQKDWRITQPSAMRADGLAVDEILRRLADARMDFAAPPIDEALFTAAPPMASVKVTDARGTQSFELRGNAGAFYLKSSAVPGVHKVEKDVAETLGKELMAFRAKKIFDFGFAEVSRLEYRDSTRQAVYERKDAEWRLNNKTVQGAPALVDKLRDLSVLRFLDAGMGAPVMEITVHSATRKESVKIAKSGNLWVAQRDGLGELYEIDGKLIEDLQKAAAEIK